MAVDIAPPSVLTSQLQKLLQDRRAALLQYLVTTNSKTAYFREAELLADFREALARSKDLGPPADPQELFEAFSSTVPFSSYDAYRPFIARFMESPRHYSEVSDLLSPGLPAFVINSSGTSGGAPKYFPKYKHPLSQLTSTLEGWSAVTPPAARGGTHCIIFNLRYSELLDVIDDTTEEATVVKRVPLCLGSTSGFRAHYQWGVENDEALMSIKGTQVARSSTTNFLNIESVPNHTSPLAACFIHSYRVSLLMHALFALEDRSVEFINTLFAPIFLDFVRLIEEYWEPLVQAIHDGKVPDFEGAEKVKHYLQAWFNFYIQNPFTYNK